MEEARQFILDSKEIQMDYQKKKNRKDLIPNSSLLWFQSSELFDILCRKY